MGYKEPTGTTNNPALVKTSMAEFFQNIVQGGRLRKDDMSGMVREMPVHVICKIEMSHELHIFARNSIGLVHRCAAPSQSSTLSAQQSQVRCYYLRPTSIQGYKIPIYWAKINKQEALVRGPGSQAS